MNNEQKSIKSVFEIEITSEDVFDSLTDAELDSVYGGYLKIEGIDGQVTAAGHEK